MPEDGKLPLSGTHSINHGPFSKNHAIRVSNFATALLVRCSMVNRRGGGEGGIFWKFLCHFEVALVLEVYNRTFNG